MTLPLPTALCKGDGTNCCDAVAGLASMGCDGPGIRMASV